MPFITTGLILIGKKVLLKGGLSAVASVLKKATHDPGFSHQFGQIAEHFGMDATKDLADGIVEGIDALADGVQAIIDFI